MILKEIRKENGFSQKEVADKIGISRATLSKIENGKQDLSSVQLFKLSRLYDIDPYKLMEVEEDSSVQFAFRDRDQYTEKAEEKLEKIEKYINTILELEIIENE